MFPYLQDLRFSLKAYSIMATKTPVENDFYALRTFKPSPSQVFLDVGANRGHTILSMLLFPDFKNKIIAFEPNPLIAKKITEIPFIKNNNRVSVHNYGLSNSHEELTLFVPFYRKWMFDGLSSFSYEEASDWLRTRLWNFNENKLRIKEFNCPVRKLDDLRLNPYFIKIDVQGFELNVLKGGENTIKLHRPILLIESINEEIIKYLEQFGYQFFSFDTGTLSKGVGKLNTFCLTKEKLSEVTN